MTGVTRDQWPLYISEVYRILKPCNGWIQCGEMTGPPIWDDERVPEDSVYVRVTTLNTFRTNSSL
jgi:hypothetical protein